LEQSLEHDVFLFYARPKEEGQHPGDKDDAPGSHDDLCGIHHECLRRRLFSTTDTLEIDMAPAAIIGLSSQPVKG
jgi:hypothetical protein